MSDPTRRQLVPTWLLVVCGIVASLFGLAALLWPGITLLALIVLFGAFSLVTGIAELIDVFRAAGEHRTWWRHLVLSILNIAVALVVFFYPGMTALLLLYVIAFWSITVGIFEIVQAFASGQFLGFVSGLLGIIVGFILLANPIAGALAFVVVIGVFAIVRGVMLLIQAFQHPTTWSTPSA